MKKENTQNENPKDEHSELRDDEQNLSQTSHTEKNLEEENEIQADSQENDIIDNEEIKISKAELKSLVDDLQKAKDKNEELRNDYLRAKAELENTRKRLIKHYDELSKERTKQLLLDVVNLLDDFERAFEAANSEQKDEKNTKSILEGIRLIETQFIQVLENKWKVVSFEAAHETFDPDKHEAMMSEEHEDISEPMVVDVFSKGYILDDKILRPAKVKVATPKQ